MANNVTSHSAPQHQQEQLSYRSAHSDHWLCYIRKTFYCTRYQPLLCQVPPSSRKVHTRFNTSPHTVRENERRRTVSESSNIKMKKKGEILSWWLFVLFLLALPILSFFFFGAALPSIFLSKGALRRRRSSEAKPLPSFLPFLPPFPSHLLIPPGSRLPSPSIPLTSSFTGETGEGGGGKEMSHERRKEWCGVFFFFLPSARLLGFCISSIRWGFRFFPPCAFLLSFLPSFLPFLRHFREEWKVPSTYFSVLIGTSWKVRPFLKKKSFSFSKVCFFFFAHWQH